MKLAALIAAALLATATATSATAARTTGASSPSAYASAYIGLYNQIAGIVAANKGNCVKMADALKAWSLSHKAEIASLEAEGPKFSHAALLMVGLSIVSQIASDAEKISADVLSCATNAQVRAALAAQSKLTKP